MYFAQRSTAYNAFCVEFSGTNWCPGCDYIFLFTSSLFRLVYLVTVGRRWLLRSVKMKMCLEVSKEDLKSMCLPRKYKSQELGFQGTHVNVGWPCGPTCDSTLRGQRQGIPKLSWIERLAILVSSESDFSLRLHFHTCTSIYT